VSYAEYWKWNMAVRAYNAFREYDNKVYDLVGDRVWHSEEINGLVCKTTDYHFDTLITILSGGRDRDFWKFYDRFETPGGKKEGKPVAWNNGFPPEKMMYKLFENPSRSAFILGQKMYEDLITLEREHEAKTRRSKNDRPRKRKG
jgi:hypothetical protein